jgi:hypothetical protein
MGPNSHFLWAFHPCFCLLVNGRERRALWDNCAIPSEEPSGLVVYIVMLPFGRRWRAVLTDLYLLFSEQSVMRLAPHPMTPENCADVSPWTVRVLCLM